MGNRKTHPYEFPLTITVRLQAPDDDEAERRAEDVLTALRERWSGMELYRPNDGGPRRLTGQPRIHRIDNGSAPRDVAHEEGTSDLCFGCRALEHRPRIVSDYMAFILDVPENMVAEQFQCARCGVTDVRIVKDRS